MKKKQIEIDKLMNSIVADFLSETDPMGSYTGVPLAGDKNPIQDADDL